MKREIQNAQQSTRLLSVANAQDINLGYCWYEDNTFSKEIITGKPLKAIVVLVQYNIIYGDVFLEESCSQAQLGDMLKSLSEKMGQKLCLLSLYSHEMISFHINEVNAALQMCGKPIWEGSYWTATEYACHDLWICSHPSGGQAPSGRGSYILRPVICMPVV